MRARKHLPSSSQRLSTLMLIAGFLISFLIIASALSFEPFYHEPMPVRPNELSPHPFNDMARFPGGQKEFINYLKESLEDKTCPAAVKNRFLVSFVVETSGCVSDVQVIRGTGSGYEQAAVVAVRQSPCWEPAVCDGKPVSQKMIVPIRIKKA